MGKGGGSTGGGGLNEAKLNYLKESSDEIEEMYGAEKVST